MVTYAWEEGGVLGYGHSGARRRMAWWVSPMVRRSLRRLTEKTQAQRKEEGRDHGRGVQRGSRQRKEEALRRTEKKLGRRYRFWGDVVSRFAGEEDR